MVSHGEVPSKNIGANVNQLHSYRSEWARHVVEKADGGGAVVHIREAVESEVLRCVLCVLAVVRSFM